MDIYYAGVNIYVRKKKSGLRLVGKESMNLTFLNSSVSKFVWLKTAESREQVWYCKLVNLTTMFHRLWRRKTLLMRCVVHISPPRFLWFVRLTIPSSLVFAPRRTHHERDIAKIWEGRVGGFHCQQPIWVFFIQVLEKGWGGRGDVWLVCCVQRPVRLCCWCVSCGQN